MLVYELFFGQSVPNRGDVTEAEWQSFLDDAVTPNFPQGYTALQGSGAWMNPSSRRTIREASRVIIVALPDAAASLEAVDRVRTAYRQQFHQQQVGMTAAPACGDF